MNRGDVVTVALSGDYGKPRPALIIQSDLYKNTESVCVLLMSSTAINVRFGRVLVEPAVQNGLRSTSRLWSTKS
jgi:mRNA interferase MazF